MVESQPAAFVNVKVGVLVLAVYVTPSIQVKLSHADLTSVPVVEFLMLRFNVTTESQPAALVPVQVAVVVDAVYNTPCHK